MEQESPARVRALELGRATLPGLELDPGLGLGPERNSDNKVIGFLKFLGLDVAFHMGGNRRRMVGLARMALFHDRYSRQVAVDHEDSAALEGNTRAGYRHPLQVKRGSEGTHASLEAARTELQTQLLREKAAAQPHCSQKQNSGGILPGGEGPCHHIEDVVAGILGHSPGSLLWKPHSMVGSARADAIEVAGGESYGQTMMPVSVSLYGSMERAGLNPCISGAVWNGKQTLMARCLRNILDPMYRLEGQNLRGYRWYLRHGLQYLLSCLRR